jgi:CHAT domain-containing protein
VPFVAERFTVAHQPSAAVAAALNAAPAGDASGVLMLGDAVYRDEADPVDSARSDDSGGPGRADFGRIRHTQSEVLELAGRLYFASGAADGALAQRLLKAGYERDVAIEEDAFRLFTGKFATRERLLGAAGRVRILHLACHGLVDAADPRRTGLYLSWNPDDDGLVSLEDVRGLELEAELVVLSACETARGRMLKGEGVQSVATAFLANGARGVVATLWLISDADTEQAMGLFYEAALADGLPPARALREAKARLRERQGVRGIAAAAAALDAPAGIDELPAAHPYFWAPFVYAGAL